MSEIFDLDKRHDFEVIDVSSLTSKEVRILWRDIADMVNDETDSPLDIAFSRMERVLLQRIGGQDNLKSYVACLVVGETRR